MSQVATFCQRRGERVRTRLPVSYGAGEIECSGFAESISEGGLYINTNEVLKVGTRLVLRVEFAGRVVYHRGEVTWAIRVPEHLRDQMVCGMGVTFLDPDPQWPAFFRQWKDGVTEHAV